MSISPEGEDASVGPKTVWDYTGFLLTDVLDLTSEVYISLKGGEAHGVRGFYCQVGILYNFSNGAATEYHPAMVNGRAGVLEAHSLLNLVSEIVVKLKGRKVRGTAVGGGVLAKEKGVACHFLPMAGRIPSPFQALGGACVG